MQPEEQAASNTEEPIDQNQLIVFDGSSFLSPSTTGALSAIGTFNSARLGWKFGTSQSKAERHLFDIIESQVSSALKRKILFAVNMYGMSIPNALIEHLNGDSQIKLKDTHARILMSMLTPENQQKIMNVDKDIVKIINDMHRNGRIVHVSTGLHVKASQAIKERHFPDIPNVYNWFYEEQADAHSNVVVVTHKDKKPHIEKLKPSDKYTVLTPEEFRRQFRRTKSGLSTQSKVNSNSDISD